MDTRSKLIVFGALALVPLSFCGCCCLTGMFGSNQAIANQQAIDAARTACIAPSVFRPRTGGLPSGPEGWECVTADVIAAEQAAQAAEAARLATAQEAAIAAQRAQIDAARAACTAPSVFRARPDGDPAYASSWDCVTPEMAAAEEERQRAVEAAAEAERERSAAAAEAARIASLPMEVSACTVNSAYQANEIAADARYPEGRRMIVTGRVDSVAETFGTMTIHPRGCMFAMVNLADDQRSIAGSLSRGDSFAADCTMGHFVMGAAWDDCRILR